MILGLVSMVRRLNRMMMGNLQGPGIIKCSLDALIVEVLKRSHNGTALSIAVEFPVWVSFRSLRPRKSQIIQSVINRAPHRDGKAVACVACYLWSTLLRTFFVAAAKCGHEPIEMSIKMAFPASNLVNIIL